jgi:hypothetical protein
LKYLNCDTQRKDRRRFFSEECLSAVKGSNNNAPFSTTTESNKSTCGRSAL